MRSCLAWGDLTLTYPLSWWAYQRLFHSLLLLSSFGIYPIWPLSEEEFLLLVCDAHESLDRIACFKSWWSLRTDYWFFFYFFVDSIILLISPWWLAYFFFFSFWITYCGRFSQFLKKGRVGQLAKVRLRSLFFFGFLLLFLFCCWGHFLLTSDDLPPWIWWTCSKFSNGV